MECAIPIWDKEGAKKTSELWNKMKPMTDDIPAKLCSGYRTAFNISWDGYMRFCLLVNEPDIPVVGQKLEICWKKLLEYWESIRWPEECYVCEYKEKCKRCLAHLACFAGGVARLDKTYCQRIKNELIRRE